MTDPAGIAPDVVFAATSKRRSPAAARSASCLTCHASHVLPRTNWTGSQHETRGVSCTDCHNIHAADQKVMNKATQAEVCFTCHRAQRAADPAPLGPSAREDRDRLAAKMACSDCHNPHGSTGPTLLRKNTVNETCYTCHAEKRGPFLWEHAPVVDELHHLPHAARLGHCRRCSRRARP